MKKHITGFYLETLLLIVVFLAILLVLTRVFGIGKTESLEAAHLSDAVTLASNAAEAVSASRDPAGLAALLGGETDGRTVTAAFDRALNSDPAGLYRVTVSWDPAADDLVYCTVTVCYGNHTDPVYTLDTAVWLGGEAA